MEYNRVLTIKKIAAVLLFALLPFAGGTLYAAVGCENKGNTTYCVSPYTTSGSSAQNSNPAFSPDWTQVSSDEYKVGGGQYLQFLVEKGTIYKWSTEGVEDAFSGMYYTKCNNDSQCPNKLACQNGNCELPFNTELTLFGNQCGPGGSNVLAFSRDGSYYNQAELEWKAEFSGLVTLLVTNYEYRVIVNQDGSQDSTYVSCQATSGNKTTTVKWQRSTQEHCTECDEASKYAYNATVQLVAETDNDGDPVYDESGNLVYVESNYTYNPKTIPGDGSADAPYWNVIQAPTAQSTATFNHYDNWIKPGSYIIFSVEEGQIYRWSTCTSEVYDTQLSLFKGKGKTGDCGDFLAYGDDASVSYKHEGDDSTNYCPEGTKQSVLEWHANFTGEVTLLFNEYNCYQCAKRDMGSHWAHCYETGENNEHQTVIYPMPLEWQRYDCLCQDSSVSAVASIADTCGMDDEGEENTCSSPWTHNDEFAGSENLKYGEYMAFSLRRGSKYIFTTTDQSAVITIKKRSEGCRGTTLAQGTGRLAYFADAKATSAADKDPNHYPDEILVLVTKADCRIPGSSSSESTRLSYSFYSDPVSSDAAARFTRSSVGGKSKFVDNSPNGLTFIDTQKWAKTWQEAMEVCSDSSLGGGSSSGIVECPPAECPPDTSVPTVLAGEADTNVWCAKGLQGQKCAKPDCTVYSNSLEYKNSGDNKGKCYFSGTSCDPTRDAKLTDKICKIYKNGKCIVYYTEIDHYKLCKTSEAKCVTKDGKCGSGAHSSDYMVGVTMGCDTSSGYGSVPGLMGCYKEITSSYSMHSIKCDINGDYSNCDKEVETAGAEDAYCPSGTTYISDLDACQNSTSEYIYVSKLNVSNGQVTDPSKCTNRIIGGQSGQCKCGVDLNIVGGGTVRVECPEPSCNASGYVYQRAEGTTAIGKCYKPCSDGYTLVDGSDGKAHCYKCNSGYALEPVTGGVNGWICSKCSFSYYTKHEGKCYKPGDNNGGYACDTANGWLQDPNNSNRCRKVSGYVKCPAGNLQCDINHPDCDLSKPNGDDDGGFECYRNYCGRDFRTDENLRICPDKNVELDGETYNLSNYEAVTIDVEGGTRKRICEVELPTGTCGKPLGSWVLPNINQLYSIVDFDLHDPATAMPFVEGDYVRAELNKGCDPDIDPANDKFGDKQCGLNGAQGDGHWICMDKQCERNNWYWSSTTVVNGDEDDGEFVWSVNMKDGRSYRAPKGCVEEENDDDEVSDDDETPDDDTAGTSCAGVTFSSRPHRVLCVKGSYYAGLFDAGLPAKEHVFSGWVCNKSSEETKLTVYFDIVDSSGVNQEGKNVVNMLEANSETIGTLPGTSRQVLIYGPTEIKPTGTTGKALSIYNNCASIGQAPDSVAPHAFEIALDGSSGHTALASTIMSIGSLTKCTEEQITANNTSDCVVPPFFVTAYAANPDVPTAIAFEISPVHQPFVFENVCGDGYETYDGNFLETCEEKDFNRECAYGEGTCPFCPEDTCVMEQHPNPQCGDGTIQSAYCENGVISEGHTGAGLTCEYYAFDNQEGGENCDCGDGHNDTMYLYENGVVKCDGTHKVTTTLCPVYGQDCEICVSCGKIAGNKRFCGDGEVQHETCVYTSEPNIGETILNCTIMAGAAEECDNKGTDGNICTPDCKRPRCGDGIQQNDEVCDDGELNGEYGKCNDKCSDWVRCGDKVWDPEHEACDLGDGHNGNTIKFSDFIAAGNADCAPTLGGISYPVNRAQFTKYKQCVKRYSDYLKANPGCNADCSAAASSYCGDGIQQTGEACDDGLPVNADGEFDTSLTEEDKYNGHRYGDKHCALDCQRYTCGDGVIDDYDEAIEDYSDMGIGKIDEDGKVTLYVYGANEKCDDGTKNGKYGHCAVGCQGKTQCGNNTTEDIDTAQGLREECDKGRDNKSIENGYDATKNTACVVEDKEICGGEYANWGDTVCCKFGRYCGDGNVDNGDGVGDADVRQDWRHKAGEEGTWIASGVTVEEEHHELAAKFTKTTDNTATAELQVKLPGEDVSVNGSHRYYLEYDFKVKNPDPAENAVVIESAVNMYDADNNEKTPNPNDIDHRAFYRESTLDQNGYNVWAHVRSAQVRDFSADGSSTLFVNGTKYVKILFRFKGSTGTQFLVKALKFYAVETQKSNQGKYGFPMPGVDGSKEMCDPGDGHFETDSTRYMTDCNSSCRWINFCGDGIVQRPGDHECDSSGKFNGYECKDGISGAAEVCDKGENNKPNVYNGCEPGCLELGPRCGDYIVNMFTCRDPEDKRCFVPTGLEKSEQCDGNLCFEDPDSCQPNNDSSLASNDGTFAVFDNLNNYGVCRTDCTWARCGDGIKDEGEECDCGVEGISTRTSASTWGQTDPENDEVYLCHSDNGSEEYYNTNKKVDRSVVCRANCKVSRCGDGMLDKDEKCDDGNLNDNDSCIGCQLAACGDGYFSDTRSYLCEELRMIKCVDNSQEGCSNTVDTVKKLRDKGVIDCVDESGHTNSCSEFVNMSTPETDDDNNPLYDEEGNPKYNDEKLVNMFKAGYLHCCYDRKLEGGLAAADNNCLFVVGGTAEEPIYSTPADKGFSKDQFEGCDNSAPKTVGKCEEYVGITTSDPKTEEACNIKYASGTKENKECIAKVNKYDKCVADIEKNTYCNATCSDVIGRCGDGKVDRRPDGTPIEACDKYYIDAPFDHAGQYQHLDGVWQSSAVSEGHEDYTLATLGKYCTGDWVGAATAKSPNKPMCGNGITTDCWSEGCTVKWHSTGGNDSDYSKKGDGYVDKYAGEECDMGVYTASGRKCGGEAYAYYCNANCKKNTGAECGDGIVQAASSPNYPADEFCDTVTDITAFNTCMDKCDTALHGDDTVDPAIQPIQGYAVENCRKACAYPGYCDNCQDSYGYCGDGEIHGPGYNFEAGVYTYGGEGTGPEDCDLEATKVNKVYEEDVEKWKCPEGATKVGSDNDFECYTFIGDARSVSLAKTGLFTDFGEICDGCKKPKTGDVDGKCGDNKRSPRFESCDCAENTFPCQFNNRTCKADCKMDSIGHIDKANSIGITGWACDPDHPLAGANKSNFIKLTFTYVDGTVQTAGTKYVTVTKPAANNVILECGGGDTHGWTSDFTGITFASGISVYTVKAYAFDFDIQSYVLIGEMTFSKKKSCGDGVPTSCEGIEVMLKDENEDSLWDVSKKCCDENTADNDDCLDGGVRVKGDCEDYGLENGKLCVDEKCDDGNKLDGDDCNSTCTAWTRCGDNILQPDATGIRDDHTSYEECDSNSHETASCKGKFPGISNDNLSGNVRCYDHDEAVPDARKCKWEKKQWDEDNKDSGCKLTSNCNELSSIVGTWSELAQLKEADEEVAAAQLGYLTGLPTGKSVTITVPESETAGLDAGDYTVPSEEVTDDVIAFLAKYEWDKEVAAENPYSEENIFDAATVNTEQVYSAEDASTYIKYKHSSDLSDNKKYYRTWVEADNPADDTWSEETPGLNPAYTEDRTPIQVADLETTKCYFECIDDLGWDGSKCVGRTDNTPCNECPDNNGIWNGGASNGKPCKIVEGETGYPQPLERHSRIVHGNPVWDKNIVASYSTTETDGCFYKCKEGTQWSGSQCNVEQQTVKCSGLPPHAKWIKVVKKYTTSGNETSWQRVISVYTGEGDMEITQKLQSDNATYAPAEGDLAPLWVEHTHKNTDEDWQYNWREIDFKDLSPQNGYPSGGKPQGTANDPLMATDTPTRCYFQCDEGYYYDLGEKKCKEGSSSSCGDGMIQAEHCENLDPQDFKKCAFTLGGTEVCDDGGTPTTYNGTYGKDTNTGKSHCDKYCGDYNICKNAHPTDYEVWCSFMLEPGYTGRIETSTSKPNGEYFCGDNVVQHLPEDECYDTTCKPVIAANYPGANTSEFATSEQCDSSDNSNRKHLCDIYLTSKDKNTASSYYETGSISCNGCKLVNNGACGFCGDGEWQNGVDANNNPIEECENTAEGIKYKLGDENKVYDKKKDTFNKTYTTPGAQPNYKVPITGIYKITVKGAQGGKGGTGGTSYASSTHTGDGGSEGAAGGEVTAYYYIAQGQSLTIYTGMKGDDGSNGGDNDDYHGGSGGGGGAGKLYGGKTGTGGSEGDTSGSFLGIKCKGGGGGAGGGGGGGASYVKISAQTLVLARGGNGGAGGDGANNTSCFNTQYGGDGGAGGEGGKYSDSEGNYHYPTATGTNYRYYSDSEHTVSTSDTSNTGNGSITIELVKYAPCKTDTCEFDESNLVTVGSSTTMPCTGLIANAVWSSNSTTSKTINQTLNSSGNWTPSTTGSYNTSTAANYCYYKCKDGYFWHNNACVKTRVVACPILTTPTDSNWEWNIVSEIVQNYNDSTWTPADTVYSPAQRPDPTTSECRFKCKEGYTYQENDYTYTQGGTTTTVEGNHCKNERIVNCEGLKAHATWWGETEKHGTPAEHTITQHWTQANGWQNTTTGSYSASAIAGECRFHCNKGYTWSDSANECVANKRTTVNCNTKPGNTDWNDGGKNGKFEQTWSDTGLGSETCNATQWANNDCWFPRSRGATYQPTTAAECGYKCSADFHTENSGSTCISDHMDPNDPSSECNTGSVDRCKCENLPTGGIANTATRIARNWENHGGTWQWWPRNSYVGNYDETASTTECKYKCWSDATHHFEWNSNSQACVGQDIQVNCTGLPEHATWLGETEKRVNPNEHEITQKWTLESGDWKWWPVKEGTYNETYIDGECHFKCNKGYKWENNQCVAKTRTEVACTYGKPEHSTWNDGKSDTEHGKFEQTWSDTGIGSETCSDSDWANNNCWFPRSKNSNHNATAGECIYKCNTNYTWNNSQSSSACNANKNTYTCTGKPDGTDWNMGSASSSHSYEQTWDEDHAGCNPSVTDPANTNSCWYPKATSATYNETANATECRYKCDANNTRWNNACVHERNISCDAATLPANTVWSKSGTTSQTIKQTWTPTVPAENGWSPSLTGTHNTATTADQCYYKCEGETLSVPHFNWNNGTCVANTKNGTCTNLPANAQWWSATITQTWTNTSGSSWDWRPVTDSPNYSASSDTSACYYKCYSSSRTYDYDTDNRRCKYCGDQQKSNGETCDTGITNYACYKDESWDDCGTVNGRKFYQRTCANGCGSYSSTLGSVISSCTISNRDSTTCSGYIVTGKCP